MLRYLAIVLKNINFATKSQLERVGARFVGTLLSIKFEKCGIITFNIHNCGNM